jgi:hypothetical protein
MKLHVERSNAECRVLKSGERSDFHHSPFDPRPAEHSSFPTFVIPKALNPEP